MSGPCDKNLIYLTHVTATQMRDLVNRFSFLARKRFDNTLHWLFPNWWVPLYTSVTFSRMRYHLCIENKKWQDRVRIEILFYIASDDNKLDFRLFANFYGVLEQLSLPRLPLPYIISGLISNSCFKKKNIFTLLFSLFSTTQLTIPFSTYFAN